MTNMHMSHVVNFKEFLFMDDDNEYLKRFYSQEESEGRVQQLTSFYQEMFPGVRPDFYGQEYYISAMMFSNKREVERHHFEKAEKKVPTEGEDEAADKPTWDQNEAKLEEEGQSEVGQYIFNNAEKEFLNEDGTRSNISYDSSIHDIYNPSFSSEGVRTENLPLGSNFYQQEFNIDEYVVTSDIKNLQVGDLEEAASFNLNSSNKVYHINYNYLNSNSINHKSNLLNTSAKKLASTERKTNNAHLAPNNSGCEIKQNREIRSFLDRALEDHPGQPEETSGAHDGNKLDQLARIVR